MTYTTNTTDNRKILRSSDARSTFPVLVLDTNAAGQLATVVRMDGRGTGQPFVVLTTQFVG